MTKTRLAAVLLALVACSTGDDLSKPDRDLPEYIDGIAADPQGGVWALGRREVFSSENNVPWHRIGDLVRFDAAGGCSMRARVPFDESSRAFGVTPMVRIVLADEAGAVLVTGDERPHRRNLDGAVVGAVLEPVPVGDGVVEVPMPGRGAPKTLTWKGHVFELSEDASGAGHYHHRQAVRPGSVGFDGDGREYVVIRGLSFGETNTAGIEQARLRPSVAAAEPSRTTHDILIFGRDGQELAHARVSGWDRGAFDLAIIESGGFFAVDGDNVLRRFGTDGRAIGDGGSVDDAGYFGGPLAAVDGDLVVRLRQNGPHVVTAYDGAGRKLWDHPLGIHASALFVRDGQVSVVGAKRTVDELHHPARVVLDRAGSVIREDECQVPEPKP